MAVKEHGVLTAIEQALNRLGIPYTKTPDGITVGDLLIRPMGDEVLLLSKARGEVTLNESLKVNAEAVAYVIYEAIKEALKGNVEVVEYAEE
ncbi:hypothetical protein [Vulcanisaeta distributa]|uniref:hypothetical protein n=1 Tax=Vulcanisaeta distributa TaxID=164451 RepID=UPI0006D20959|nr:hypothetical protein [Vulcanisaeta distributa]